MNDKDIFEKFLNGASIAECGPDTAQTEQIIREEYISLFEAGKVVMELFAAKQGKPSVYTKTDWKVE